VRSYSDLMASLNLTGKKQLYSRLSPLVNEGFVIADSAIKFKKDIEDSRKKMFHYNEKKIAKILGLESRDAYTFGVLKIWVLYTDKDKLEKEYNLQIKNIDELFRAIKLSNYFIDSFNKPLPKEFTDFTNKTVAYKMLNKLRNKTNS